MHVHIQNSFTLYGYLPTDNILETGDLLKIIRYICSYSYCESSFRDEVSAIQRTRCLRLFFSML
jgi:hypothetical protein